MTKMQEMEEQLYKLAVVPVVVLEDAEAAVPLAQALCAGGLPCAEVTFRTAAAEEAIRRMTQAFPEMLVGAGTVLTTEQVDRATRAGAAFIVSPGLDPAVVTYCLEREIPVFPGVVTPSEVMQAVKLGLQTVKFFPAAQYGGAGTIKALGAVFRSLRFMPTGGVNAGNLGTYLALPQVLACGGSWMVKSELIQAGRFAEIQTLTQEAAALAAACRQN